MKPSIEEPIESNPVHKIAILSDRLIKAYESNKELTNEDSIAEMGHELALLIRYFFIRETSMQGNC